MGPSRDEISPNIDDLLSINPKKNFTSTSTSTSTLTKFEIDGESKESEKSDRNEEEEKAFIEDSMQKDIAASKNKKWGNNDVNQGYYDGRTSLDKNDELENSEAKSLNDQLNALKPPSPPGLFSGTLLFLIFFVIKKEILT